MFAVEALDALHRVHALDLGGDAADERERLGSEQTVRSQRDDQRPLSAELLAEAFVGLVDGIVLRDPHADVVFDLGEVGERLERKEPGGDDGAERVAKVEDQCRDAGAHRAPASSCRRLKSSSESPTL